MLQIILITLLKKIMSEDQLIIKLKDLPDHLKQEVLDFADFLSIRYQQKKNKIAKPIFGSAKGKYVMADDFHEPLEDFKEYM
jgi:hypothetical protein